MGFWKSDRGLNGDGWADEMGRCMKALAKQTCPGSKLYGDNEHEIIMAEFADLVEFCSRGHIVAELRYQKDGDRPLAQLNNLEVETYPNRGQIHCDAFCKGQ